MTLSRDSILSAQDLPSETVPVPEWGGDVIVRSLTGSERDIFEASLVKGDGKTRVADLTNLRAKLCGLCIVDEAGDRVFADGDMIALGGKSASALDRVFAVAQRLNALSSTEVEAIEKNSEAAPSGSPTSA